MRFRLANALILLALAAGLSLILMAFGSAFAQDAGPGEVAGAIDDAGDDGADAGAPEVPVDTPVADDPAGAVERFITAVREGNIRIAVGLGLSLLMIVLARIRKKVPWFSGDRGGAILVMLLSLLGAFGTALLSDATLDYKLILGAIGVAWTAVGGYTWVKRLIWPPDQKKPAPDPLP